MGLKSDFSQVLTSVVAFLSTRWDIANVEWAQEKQRIKRITLSFVIAALLLFSAWLLCHVAIIAYVWDTNYRYLVIGGLVLLYAVIAMVLLLRTLRLCQTPVFPYTKSTLKADVAYFKGTHFASTASASETGNPLSEVVANKNETDEGDLK